MYRWIGGLVVAVLVLGAGVGCGGGGDGTSSDVTKAEFVKKADLICADFKEKRQAAADKEYNKLQEKGPTTTGAKATEEWEAKLQKVAEKLLTETVFPLIREQQKELEALDVPAADEEKIEKMFANLDKAIDEIEAEGYEGIVGGNQFDDFESDAQKYGLKCGLV